MIINVINSYQRLRNWFEIENGSPTPATLETHAHTHTHSSDNNDDNDDNDNKYVSKVEKVVKKEVENQSLLSKLQPSGNALAAPLPSSSNPADREIVEASYAFINIKGKYVVWLCRYMFLYIYIDLFISKKKKISARVATTFAAHPMCTSLPTVPSNPIIAFLLLLPPPTSRHLLPRHWSLLSYPVATPLVMAIFIHMFTSVIYYYI